MLAAAPAALPAHVATLQIEQEELSPVHVREADQEPTGDHGLSS